ncbi:hypothetical protein PVAP13_6KG389900 [Panicum virgatum]|uniref:Transcription initiation factor TFIID component TAF4 C-terminal domain-containing protein n=1 Tax=Panicum virgatum TaxID=38727 RepID=A0A8T0RJZ4_PANVG|nr:hypothetical protein PVAP13_6KG389900 [Panicum virgatum]
MSEATDAQLQATEQEVSVHASQQAGQPHMNATDQFSRSELVTEGSKSEQPVQVEQQNPQLQQFQPENRLQQAETNCFQLAEKETGSFGQQSFSGSKVDVAQPSVAQQSAKQVVGLQAPSGAQDTRKGPSIPFNMLIPILQAFAPQPGTQAQTSAQYLSHDNPNQNPDAKVPNAISNQPPRMNSAVSLQTKNKQQQPTQFQQASQQIYGASNPGAQGYPRSITGSLRPPNPVPETHAHGMPPAKVAPPPTHPMMQHNAVAWQMHQNKELKTNTPPPNANAKQNSESAGKARTVGAGNSSAKGKQGPPNSSTPNASGGAKSNKKSGGQKKSSEAAGSTQPSSKKQKTSGAFQEQSIDQLNDVTAVSGVNIREEEEQLLSAPKEESLASQEARRIAQEEEENLFLRKGPLLKKLVEIARKCNLKNVNVDVEHCLSMCVEERLRRFISTLIRVSKQRIDTEKTGHRLVITSDVGRQILQMNQKAKEEWDKKQAEEADKNKKQTEADGSGAAELEKEKEESRPKNVKPNKEEDDKMRTNAANVAARQAVGGSDMLSKWQLMAEQARQKREGLDVAAASQQGKGPGPRPLSKFGKGLGENQEGSKRSHSAAFGTGGMKRPGRTPFAGPQRTISVKDVICALEREPQMTKSRLIYRLHERLPGDSSAD